MAKERSIVVGAGGISHAWFAPLVTEGVQVAAVVDLNIDAARKQIEKYNLTGAIASSDLDAVLRDVRADFLIDLTIPAAHRDVTCKALEAGLHVVGEKPMAATLEQARQMIATSERTGKLFMTSQSRRWDAKHATIARASREGAIGDVTAVNCDFFIAAHFGGFRDEMDNVLILDMAIHHFDLARLFTGLNATRVWCHETNPRGSWYRGSPAATCVFEMENGVQFVYRGSWCAEGFPTSWNGDWRVIGTKGSILYTGDADPIGKVIAADATPKFMLEMSPLSIPVEPLEAREFHGALREMLRFLRTGQKPQTECHDNIHSLAMVHAAIESSRRGTWVTL